MEVVEEMQLRLREVEDEGGEEDEVVGLEVKKYDAAHWQSARRCHVMAIGAPRPWVLLPLRRSKRRAAALGLCAALKVA